MSRMNKVIYLLRKRSVTNSMGDPVTGKPDMIKVFAEKKSVRQSEFYQAAAVDLKPQITFIVWTKLYKGEQEIMYEGEAYKVLRTYEKEQKKMELVVTKVGRSTDANAT